MKLTKQFFKVMYLILLINVVIACNNSINESNLNESKYESIKIFKDPILDSIANRYRDFIQSHPENEHDNDKIILSFNTKNLDTFITIYSGKLLPLSQTGEYDVLYQSINDSNIFIVDNCDKPISTKYHSALYFNTFTNKSYYDDSILFYDDFNFDDRVWKYKLVNGELETLKKTVWK